MRVRQKIGSILVEIKMISQEDLDKCLDIQKRTGEKLGEILLSENLVTKEHIAAILEYQYGVPFVDLTEFEIDPLAPREIDEKIARKHDVLPVGFNHDENKLIVVMADPMDFVAKDDLRLITGQEIEVLMAFKSDLHKKLDTFYDSSQADLAAILTRDAENAMGGESLVPIGTSAETNVVTDSPVVRLVNSLISGAIKKRASDIHMEPFESIVLIRFRIDGDLKKEMEVPVQSYVEMVSRIKIMGGMDISEKRAPQDGRVETEIDGRAVDLRISLLPTVYGEKAVIRILERSNINMTKEQIGFSEANIVLFDEIMKAPEGIILLTGPTGSGKTTTLYAALQELNNEKTNIITAEDPVEYRLHGVNQVHINPKAGLTFAATLRSILRQDPDVIMVGEIRDGETAEIAIRAAITGHLVLSTLHTNDTVSTITRLIDMGIEPFLVSTSLVGVISQRLVKRICQKCKREVPMTEEDMKNMKLDKPIKIYKGTGCRECNETGYKGRIAVHEILTMDRSMKNSVARGDSVDKLRVVAEEKGMVSLAESSRRLVIDGITTIEEMLRVAFSIEE